MRILIRTSKWAIWARRLASLAVPLVVLPILLHRLGIIRSPEFVAATLVAGGLAGAATLASLIALVRLWYTGDQGWGRAIAGLFLGLFCLLPFAWYGQLALRYPHVTDIATTDRAALPLVFDPDTRAMPPPVLLSATDQAEHFPNVTTRVYPLDVVQLFTLAERLVEGQGWDVRLRREPNGTSDPGRLNARIITLEGWREEVALRIAPTPSGAAVDMRSVSLDAPFDFGSNGNRISDFLVTLDTEITALLRDNPTINQPGPADEAPLPVDTDSEATVPAEA